MACSVVVNLKPIALVTGTLLHTLALFMYIPAALAFIQADVGGLEFSQSIVVTHIAALMLQFYGRRGALHMAVREMFLITTSVWVVTTTFAALPFIFIEHISFTDAYFETMSGLTTTGSTVLSGLDEMPHSILLWRSLLHWIGGIGFIVMGLAVLPYLNVGGMRLFQTESSDWSEKHTPKTRELARQILKVYIALTLLCTLAYRLAGMTFFESINHAMATLSTGGFSTTDQSMTKFSPAAHWVAIFFMILGGVPFLMLLNAVKKRSWRALFRDQQVRGFLGLIAILALLMTVWLVHSHVFPFWDALRISLFNIVSITTTTGFGLTDFSDWGHFTSVLFIFLFLAGACSGSTSGGFKVFRVQLAWVLFKHQINRMIHPRGVFPLRYNRRTIDNSLLNSVGAFAMAFSGSIIILASLVALTGADPITAVSGAMTAICNVGPGFGDIIGPAYNFHLLNDTAKWLLSFGMLLGRLEIFTLAIVFFPRFWR